MTDDQILERPMRSNDWSGGAPPGGRQLARRAACVISGGLMAAVSVIAAVASLHQALTGLGPDRTQGILACALAAVAYTAGIFTLAYGWNGLDSAKARRTTVTVVLISVAVIAVLAAAGGSGWSSDDKESGDSSGGDGGSGNDDCGSDRWTRHGDRNYWGWSGAFSNDSSLDGQGSLRRTSEQASGVCSGCGRPMSCSAGYGLCAGCAYQARW